MTFFPIIVAIATRVLIWMGQKKKKKKLFVPPAYRCYMWNMVRIGLRHTKLMPWSSDLVFENKERASEIFIFVQKISPIIFWSKWMFFNFFNAKQVWKCEQFFFFFHSQNIHRLTIWGFFLHKIFTSNSLELYDNVFVILTICVWISSYSDNMEH